MNEKIAAIRKELEQKQKECAGLESRLASYVRSCRHEWEPIRYVPRIREGYQSEGDPPGTMGVDWRGPMWIPREETPRWVRKCSKCGHEQFTESTTKKEISGTIPGTKAFAEVPFFSDYVFGG
jgi:hypothetical protein